ncbi:J domain-containing protein [uncultured Enorma sp.]|uniref:J domain-containing protein n=1 Tax=uncultured Enorma sp. TaxID=1714346 RepID=UPI00262A31ED|nr:J domain-containing protein [uncultured Enorma sp.]
MTRDEALSVLGLEPGVSRAEILAAYRELAQMLHPDKFGENKRLRARAEQQMKRINEARDVLLKAAGASSRGGSASRREGRASADSSPEAILFEATARARAAETARLAVVAQLRTMRERRRSMLVMAGVAAIVAFLFLRVRGGLGAMIASIASMVAVWGVVDAVMLSSQVEALKTRSRELLQTRDAARKIAEEAARL